MSTAILRTERELASGWRYGLRIAVFALVLGTFLPSTSYGLLAWDDGRIVGQNPDVHRIGWSEFASIWEGPHFEAYQPVHLLSYWLDVPFFGDAGPALHAVNALLWALAATLIFEVLLGFELAPLVAMLSALAFALHPVQVEVATWITGRKDIVSTIFVASCLLCHQRVWHWNDRAAWLSRAFYLLAIFSKTTALPLPVGLVLIDVLLARRTLGAAFRMQLPALIAAGVLGSLVFWLWNTHQLVRDPEVDRALLLLATYVHHAWVAVWPAKLAPMHALAREVGLDVPATLLGCGAGVVVSGIAWRGRRSWVGQRVLIGLGWFALFLLPVSNAVPLYFQWQDRYLSLPLFGLVLALGAVLSSVERTMLRWASLGFAAIVFLLMLRTVQYQQVWRSDLALWGHAVSVEPRSFYAWMKLGEARREARQHEGAEQAYRRAIQLSPQLVLGHAALFAAILRAENDDLGRSTEGESDRVARFASAVEDSGRLRRFAGELAEEGYRRSALHVLDRALTLVPVDDAQLERAARIQLGRGHIWLATFYLRRMHRLPVDAELRAIVER